MNIPRTLVLNKDYVPINIFPLHHIEASEAIKRVFNETCHVVTEYDRHIKTPNHIVKWPAIIARNDYLNREKIAILNKEAIYYRDNKKCSYCSVSLTRKEATFDHVIPRALGGKHIWENIVIACANCNHSKGMISPLAQNGKWLPKNTPYKPTYGQLLNIRRNYPIKIFHESWLDFIGPWNSEVTIEK